MKKLTLIDRSCHMQPAVGRLVDAFHQLGYIISPGDMERAYSDWSENNYAASWYMLPEEEEDLLELCKRLLDDGLFDVSEEESEPITPEWLESIGMIYDDEWERRCIQGLPHVDILHCGEDGTDWSIGDYEIPNAVQPKMRNDALAWMRALKVKA